MALPTDDTVYQFRITKQDKQEAFSVIKSYGLKPSQAMRMFLKEVRRTKKIPLSLDTIPNKQTQDILQTPYEKLDFTEVKQASDLLKI